MNIEEQIKKNTAIKRRTAVLFGLLAGLAFSTVAWGIDAYRLWQAHAFLPWLQFILGAVTTGLIGALAAFLAYRFNSIFISFILWLIAGLLFSWLGGHVQFQLTTTTLQVLAPDLAARVSYPYNAAIAGHQFLINLAVTALCVLAGLLSVNQIENAAEAAGGLGMIFALFLWLVIFSIAGYVVRDNLTVGLTDPVVGTNQLIQFALDNEGKPVDRQTALDMHLRSVDPIRDLIHSPRKLILSEYDEWLSTTLVWINFDGVWVRCMVLGSLVNACERQ